MLGHHVGTTGDKKGVRHGRNVRLQQHLGSVGSRQGGINVQWEQKKLVARNCRVSSDGKR